MSNTNHGWGSAPAAGRAISTGSGFSVGQAFNQAVTVFDRSPLQFILVTALCFVPLYIVELAIGRRSNAGAFTGLFIQVVVSSIANATCLYGAYQVIRGRSFSVGESFSIGLRRFGPVLGTSVLASLIIGVGMIALIVPGLIIAAALYVALPVCVIERLGAGASLRRSRELTAGYRWQVFGLLLLVVFITLIVAVGAGFIVAFGGVLIQQVVELGIQVLSGAFGAVLNAVVYYNLRSVKEGVDIDQLASVFD